MEENNVRSNSTEIKRITAFGDFGQVEMQPMARNKYAYTYLHNDIDSISFEVEIAEGAKSTIRGNSAMQGEDRIIFPLDIGRNIFDITIIAPDGTTKRECELKVFRACSTPVWKKLLENAPWCPRDSAGELIYQNNMWLFGGYIPELTNDVWRSPDGIHWTHTGNVPTANGVDIPVTFIFKEKMYVIDVKGVLFSSVDGVSWDIVTSSAPWYGRRAMGGAVFNGRIWVMGGIKDNFLYNDVWSSEDGVNWDLELNHAPWSKRQISHSLLVYNNKLWLFGGGAMGPSYFPFVAYNDVWCTEDGIHWDRITAHAPWPSRIWGSTIVYKNRMWIMGGYHSEPESRHFGDIWYSVDGLEWTEYKQHAHCWKRSSGNVPVSIPAQMWEDRHEASVMVLNDTLYLMAGMIWPLKNDIWKLRIDGLCFFTQPVFECYVDCLYEYKAFADFSASGQKAKYRLVEAPEWLSIDKVTGYIYGTSQTEAHEKVIVEAYDDFGEVAHQEYILHIIPLA